MRRREVSSEEVTGFLDQGTAVTGELQFSGTLRIDGHFHGSIATSDILTIGEHGAVHADIKVGEIEVHGHVSGNIEAKRRITIHSTGRVNGEIRTPNIVIEAGGDVRRPQPHGPRPGRRDRERRQDCRERRQD